MLRARCLFLRVKKKHVRFLNFGRSEILDMRYDFFSSFDTSKSPSISRRRPFCENYFCHLVHHRITSVLATSCTVNCRSSYPGRSYFMKFRILHVSWCAQYSCAHHEKCEIMGPSKKSCSSGSDEHDAWRQESFSSDPDEQLFCNIRVASV